MPLGRDEIGDEQWQEFNACLSLLAQEHEAADPEKQFLLIKKYWKLLTNKKRCQEFVGRESLRRLREAKREQDKARPALNKQIKDLEEKYPDVSDG